MQGAANFIRLVMLVVISMYICACTNVAVSGAQAAYNHKSLENSINDHVIAFKANHAFNNPNFKGTNISIAVLNREVLLSGEVGESWQKEKAGELIKNIENVSEVYNYLTISGNASSLSQTSDTWLTAKVKSKIIASRDIDATRIKVVSERGTVYLMGVLTPEEAEEAVDIASTTDGVTSVVKLFSYMKITKTL